MFIKRTKNNKQNSTILLLLLALNFMFKFNDALKSILPKAHESCVQNNNVWVVLLLFSLKLFIQGNKHLFKLAKRRNEKNRKE